jgi:hypothetical protein
VKWWPFARPNRELTASLEAKLRASEEAEQRSAKLRARAGSVTEQFEAHKRSNGFTEMIEAAMRHPR